MNRRFFLKHYILDPEFQYAFIARNLIVLFLTILTLAAAIFAWNTFRVKEGFLIRPPQ